jgi:Shedu protein SduA, C-terminal
LPQKRLGAEHVPDFMVADRDSAGFEWTAVELESPLARMFTKRGELASVANHAIRQIEDWRIWLGRNRDYAARPRDESGLGLVDIDANVAAWIVIGRRADLDPAFRERRRERSHRMNVKFHTYDWLLEVAKARADSVARSRAR